MLSPSEGNDDRPLEDPSPLLDPNAPRLPKFQLSVPLVGLVPAPAPAPVAAAVAMDDVDDDDDDDDEPCPNREPLAEGAYMNEHELVRLYKVIGRVDDFLIRRPTQLYYLRMIGLI